MREGYPRASMNASEAVVAEWLRRVEEEYRSAAITQHLTLWLLQLAVSPDLIRAGLAIVDDELEHATLAHRVYVEAGGTGAPVLGRERLGLVRHEGVPLEADVARACIRIFCLGETVAVPLFRALREGCRVPVAREALDRVLRDEVSHRDFGWTLLDALLASPAAETTRAVATEVLAGAFRELRAGYGGPNAWKPTDDERAWGLMSPAEYAAVVERTFEKEWQPRFGERGLDPAEAWRSAAPPAPLVRG